GSSSSPPEASRGPTLPVDAPGRRSRPQLLTDVPDRRCGPIFRARRGILCPTGAVAMVRPPRRRGAPPLPVRRFLCAASCAPGHVPPHSVIFEGRERDEDDPDVEAVPRRQGALSGRDPVLSPGRLLRDVLR